MKKNILVVQSFLLLALLTSSFSSCMEKFTPIQRQQAKKQKQTPRQRREKKQQQQAQKQSYNEIAKQAMTEEQKENYLVKKEEGSSLAPKC